jgi:ATP-dependent RNA helicase DeaD
MAMSEFGELNLAPAVAAALASFGYAAADPAVRDQVPAAARGTNLALAWPPAARYAAPALAGLVSALGQTGGRALVLAPSHTLAEWAAVLFPLADSAGLPTLSAATPGRATRRLREGGPGILLTTPATALALHERSALKPEQLNHVVLAWPELFGPDDVLSGVMQDVPLEAQRILILAAPATGHSLLERYARRALVIGPLASAEALPPGPAVRVALTGWSQRPAALAALVEAEDPPTLMVWCADQRSAGMARAALPVADQSIHVVTPKDATRKVALAVAWDLPAPADLARLAAAGELVLLVPPHAAPYVTRITSCQTPVRLRGALDEAREEAAKRLLAIHTEIEQADLDGALLALAPLFERVDPARVAAALYRLWCGRPEPVPATTSTAQAPVGETARIWVGVGKKDGTTPADLVAALARDVGVQATRIGRIEIRELFSLVEVPAIEAEEIARSLSGRTIRRRRIVARLDRGGRPSDGSRGPSGSSPREKRVRPRP